MGIAKIYNQKQTGIDINGIVHDYYVYAGERISTGDFVEFIKGIASQKIETSTVSVVDNTNIYAYACKIDEKRVFLAELYNYEPEFVGRVLTFDDTKISVGETYTILSSLSNQSEAFVNMKLLDKNKIIIAYSGYTTNAVVCTISGSEIIVGTHVTIGAGTSSYPDVGNQLGIIDNSTVLLCWSRYRNSTSTTYGIKAVILTISGSTITKNTTVNVTASSSGSVEYLSLSQMSSTKAMLFYRDIYNDSQGQSLVFTINGTSISTSSNRYTFLTDDLGNSDNLNSLPINSTQAILVYPYSGGSAVIATMAGSSITFGESINFRDSQCNEISISHISEEDLLKVMVAYFYGGAGGYYTQILSVSGTSINYGVAYAISKSSSSAKNVHNFSLVNIFENTVVNISAYADDAGNVVDAQLLGVDGLNISNTIILPTYETQVRKVTTSNVYGISDSNGIGGTSAEHNDIVSILQPQSLE